MTVQTTRSPGPAAAAQDAPVGTIVRSHASPEAIAATARYWTPDNLAELRRSLKAAFDAVNIAVGEVALALEPDDPRGPGLRQIQGGLDVLWAATTGGVDPGSPDQIDRRRLDAAFHQIGHRSSPKFRARVAAAYDAATIGEAVAS